MTQSQFLDDRPAEDLTSKTLNYINGNHFVQEDSENELVVAINSYGNGQVVNTERYTTERNLRSTKLTQDAPPGFKPPADTSDLQAHGTRKRKTGKRGLGGHSGIGNYEMKTRLRTRKSQAGL